MISVRQAVEVLVKEQNRRKQIASAAAPGSKEHADALQQVEAFSLALHCLEHWAPKPPMFDPMIGSYKCGICGCIVGFEVKPGVRCPACPQCMNRVDWNFV